MVSEKGSTIRGFRNVLNLQEFHRGQLVLFGPDPQKIIAASGSRRGLCVWLVVVCLGLLPLVGCQDFNPYLGAASTESSTITLITPSSRPAGCSGFTLDVKGIGFNSASVVDWNGSPRSTNFESSSELLATINDSDVATQVPVSIVINTPQPPGQQNQGNNLSNFVSFTIAPAPINGTSSCPAAPTFPPTISGVQPIDATVASTLEIAGNYFGGVQNSSTVTFNGTAATATSWSGTLIEVTVPSIVPSGTLSVSATVVVTINGVVATPLTAGANLVNVLPEASSSSVVVSSLDSSKAVTTPRYVALVSSSADALGAADTAMAKILLRDTCQHAPPGCSPTTIPVSVGFDGGDPNGASRAPTVSANGRFVAFVSDANNLVRGDANGVSDIFVRDTCIGAPRGCIPTTTRVSTGPDGIEANAASTLPSISLDGRFVAFHSVATNLVSDVQLGTAANSEGRFLWDSCFGTANDCKPTVTKLKFLAAPR